MCVRKRTGLDPRSVPEKYREENDSPSVKFLWGGLKMNRRTSRDRFNQISITTEIWAKKFFCLRGIR